MKKNISYLNSQQILEKVIALNGVTYHWNDTQTGTTRPTDLQYGFIAQEIQTVFPEKIQTDKQGFLMAAYGDFDPMIVEAIKALNQKIEKLEKENIEMRSENEDFRKQLNRMEAVLNKITNN